MTICNEPTCDRAVRSRGWCNAHYEQWRRTGRTWPLGSVFRNPLEAFWARVDKNGPVAEHMTTPCWIWTGAKTPKGYGSIWLPNRVVYTHRFSYEHHVGPIPDGLTIDHLCRITLCVNPPHLEPVTKSENTRRAVEFNRQQKLLRRSA